MKKNLKRQFISIMVTAVLALCICLPVGASEVSSDADVSSTENESTENGSTEMAADADAYDKDTPDIPSIKSVSIYSKTSLLVTINKVKGVTGYYIYDVKEDGSLKKLKTISDNHTSQFIVSGLKYKKTYNLAIKSYKKNKNTGKKILSALSDVYTKKLRVKSSYKDGLKYYYDMDGNVITRGESFISGKKKYQIKVNTKKCVVTVYAKDGKKAGYTIPVRSFLCAPGTITKSGSYKLGPKSRYRVLFHSCYSQWTARIYGNILFHTSPYTSYGNNDTLDVGEYNKMGTVASHGCVRMQCVGIKWIYDNCPTGTPVVIYKSDKAGPFGKPELEKLPKWHKWDPTDPTAVKKCEKKNCDHKIY